MDEKELKFSTRMLWISFWTSVVLLYGLQFLFLTVEGKKMEWWGCCISAAGVIIAALITGVVTYRVNKNSQLKKNIDAIDDLKNKIGGDSKEKSIHTQLGVGDNDKSISNQLGVKDDDKSLTLQNAEILKAVNSYAINEKEKLKKFSNKQKDIAKTVDDVNCFLKDWEQKTVNEQNLKTELTELKASLEKSAAQISLLQTNNARLTAENETLKHNNALLSSALQQPQSESSDEQDYER